MARAGVYDKWEDVGLAFSDDAVSEWDAADWISVRVAQLENRFRLLHRRSELPGHSHPKLNAKMKATTWSVATWLVRVASLEGLVMNDWKELPDPEEHDGKMLTKAAQELEPKAFLEEWQADCVTAITYFVTISRRAHSLRENDRKAYRSLCNKIANALTNELTRVSNLLISMNSISSSTGN